MAIKLTPQQQKMIAAVVLCVGAVGYLYVALFWVPISRDIDDMQKKIVDIEAKIDKAKKEAARLPRLQADLKTLSEQAVEAERRLPRNKEVPDILVTLNGLAQRYHVSLMTFSPGAQTNKQFFVELNYPVAVRGSFHNIGKFLASLSLEERIFNVSNVTYGEAASATGEMQVSFTLLSYQYKG